MKVGTTVSREWTLRLAMASLALVGAIATGASFSAASTTGARGAPRASTRDVQSLCSSSAAVTSFVITRSRTPNPMTFDFPSRVRVTNASRTRAVARALCALPAMPQGILCPADFGPTYVLAFSAPGVDVATVALDPTGCQGVAGLGGSRWLARTPGFWRVLGDSMGLHAPTHSTFAGSMG